MQFLQSTNDFPLNVSLGNKSPSFGLHRFNSGLRFVPPDDEGFTMRGDKRRLLYKGRRRSHRFTILGDTAFEYDCILLREPESNVIALRIEGAENFDFFRQPDFVPDTFLKGSYAVYKKETLIGEGTGKLCHIHRPLIIDARGRRCWGTLAVVGNELRITIPEWFLSEAKYPVIVDPTIGTATVGSQDTYVSGEWYDEEEDESGYNYSTLRLLNDSVMLNKVSIPENIGTIGNFYVYKRCDGYQASIKRCYPCMYNDANNLPNTKISNNEAEIIDPYGYNNPGWLQASFSKNSPINAGDRIWFGVRANCLYMKFDYGGILEYFDLWNPYYYDGILLPEVLGGGNTPRWTTEYNREIKISMYFTYEKQSINYIRTITQGVKLTDSRKLTAGYKRNTTQTAGVNSSITRFGMLVRNCVMTAGNSMNINRLPVFLRNVAESVKVITANRESRSISRKCDDSVNAISITKRIQGIIRKVQDLFNAADMKYVSIFFVRAVTDTVHITHIFKNWGAFFRGLLVCANTAAETSHKAEYYRFHADTVQAAGAVFRGLLLFVRIVTKVFIRDYLLSRFLIAREELILKSCIVREIVLESKIN